MADDKKDETPKNIKKFTKLYDTAHKVANTIDIAHSKAYADAAEKHLKDSDGNIDYKLLKKSDIQEKFAEEMSQRYLKDAKDYFKIKGDDEETALYVDQIMQSYAGLSKSQLLQMIRQEGDKYTVDAHNQRMYQLKQRMRQQLTESASNHLTDDDIGDLVKHMKADKILDTGKMRIEDGLENYQHFYEHKVLSREMVNYKAPYLIPEKKDNKYKKP